MVSIRAADLDLMLQEILEAAEGKLQHSEIEKANSRSVERMVRQCYALLHQELERKVKREPDLYSRTRMEQVLQGFKAAMPDIQDAILTRVTEGISELARQEIGRLLKDAMRDLQDAIVEPLPREDRSPVQPPTRTEGPKLPEETQPAPEPDHNGSAPKQRLDPPERPKDIPQEQAVHQLSPAPSPSAAVEREDQDTDTPADAGSPEQERHEAAGDEIYKGNVKVSVDAHGGVKQMMSFMNQLSSNTELQVQQLLGTYDTVTLWLGLRRPIALRDLFSKMESVSEVTARFDGASKGSDYALHLVLKRDPMLAGQRTDN